MAISKRMGFEGILYYGVAGSTAATQLTNTRDITETFDIEEGDTTIRGDGTAAPIKTSRVTARGYEIAFQMLAKSDDASFLALMAAAVAGTPVALRSKLYSSGLGYDGDVILSWSHGKPLKGEQTVDFTAKPNDDNRTPQFNV